MHYIFTDLKSVILHEGHFWYFKYCCCCWILAEICGYLCKYPKKTVWTILNHEYEWHNVFLCNNSEQTTWKPKLFLDMTLKNAVVLWQLSSFVRCTMLQCVLVWLSRYVITSRLSPRNCFVCLKLLFVYQWNTACDTFSYVMSLDIEPEFYKKQITT